MKRFFEFVGISAIVLFSFYYTEKVALLVQSKNSLMIDIKEAATGNNVEAVNAEIYGDEIVPGLNGQIVNVNKSYLKMKSFGLFNHYYLIFDEIKPQLSIEDNKSKTIIKGNKSKKAVSFIIENNESLKRYFNENNIQTTIISYLDSYQEEISDQINGESDKMNFSNLESILNNKGKNIHICLVNEKNKEICSKNKKYLVKETVFLNSSNLVEVKSQIESGSIILIKEGAKIEDINLLINQIKYQGLTIIPLKDLISEKINFDK